MEWSACSEERLSLEGLLHCLKAYQRLPHDGLHSGEESCIHGDEAREEAGAMLFWKFEVVSREVGALRWELGGSRQSLTALELFLGIAHSITPSSSDLRPGLTSVAWFL